MVELVLGVAGLFVAMAAVCLAATWVVVWGMSSEVSFATLPRFVTSALRSRLLARSLGRELERLLQQPTLEPPGTAAA